jgi:hypothetical protein
MHRYAFCGLGIDCIVGRIESRPYVLFRFCKGRFKMNVSSYYDGVFGFYGFLWFRLSLIENREPDSQDIYNCHFMSLEAIVFFFINACALKGGYFLYRIQHPQRHTVSRFQSTNPLLTYFRLWLCIHWRMMYPHATNNLLVALFFQVCLFLYWISPLRTEFHLNNIYKFTSYLTGSTNTSQLMLIMKMVAVYCENKMKHTNTVFWENPDLRYVKACGTYNNHWAFKG